MGRAINNAGQVVGWASTSTGDIHAFIYTDGQMTDLNALIDSTPGITLSSTNGINDHGQILASSSPPTYLLTPVPEPS